MVVTINVQSVIIGISQVGRKGYSRRSEMNKAEMDAWTARMDGWEGDPYDPERWQTYYQCNSCAHWTLFQSDQEHHGHYLPEHRCEQCGGKNFNQQSATSKRTFNVERARKKENDLKKLIEKKKQAAR